MLLTNVHVWQYVVYMQLILQAMCFIATIKMQFHQHCHLFGIISFWILQFFAFLLCILLCNSNCRTLFVLYTAAYVWLHRSQVFCLWPSIQQHQVNSYLLGERTAFLTKLQADCLNDPVGRGSSCNGCRVMESWCWLPSESGGGRKRDRERHFAGWTSSASVLLPSEISPWGWNSPSLPHSQILQQETAHVAEEQWEKQSSHLLHTLQKSFSETWSTLIISFI